jgi:hypothetical protein
MNQVATEGSFRRRPERQGEQTTKASADRITRSTASGLKALEGAHCGGQHRAAPGSLRFAIVDVVTTDEEPGCPDSEPRVDARHPADVVVEMVDHVLRLAATWPRWDGTPFEVSVDGDVPRTYTPHKAIRRVTDHLIDHLAELEARVGSRPTAADEWRGSSVTTAADLALFTDDDLDEARSRLVRLGDIWNVRLRTLTDDQLDASHNDAWTLRQVAFHVSESVFYADSVGLLNQ